MERRSVSKSRRASAVNNTLSNKSGGIRLSRGQKNAILSQRATKKAK